MEPKKRVVGKQINESMVFKRCVCVDLNRYCIHRTANSNMKCGPSGFNGMTNTEDSRMRRLKCVSVLRYAYISYLVAIRRLRSIQSSSLMTDSFRKVESSST